jgi:hypothetical protein
MSLRHLLVTVVQYAPHHVLGVVRVNSARAFLHQEIVYCNERADLRPLTSSERRICMKCLIATTDHSAKSAQDTNSELPLRHKEILQSKEASFLMSPLGITATAFGV